MTVMNEFTDPGDGLCQCLMTYTQSTTFAAHGVGFAAIRTPHTNTTSATSTQSTLSRIFDY